MDRSRNKRPIYATRDFPPGCGTPSNASASQKRYADRDFPPGYGPCSNASSSRHLETSNKRTDAVPIPSNRASRQIQRDPTPRERVHEVLRAYEQVYNRLKQEKEERRGGDLYQATDRIDLKTKTELEEMGKVVNSEKRIGHVPGIEVGDKFTYRTELRVVGLHLKPMCGIDYMEIGGILYATCVVSSEGYDYEDKFGTDYLDYTGEGGNVISKNKHHEDQKMVRGNLALANSMRHRKPVRVVRGDKSLSLKGKNYVYCGLYLVENYSSKIIEGKNVYKFRLRRMSE